MNSSTLAIFTLIPELFGQSTTVNETSIHFDHEGRAQVDVATAASLCAISVHNAQTERNEAIFVPASDQARAEIEAWKNRAIEVDGELRAVGELARLTIPTLANDRLMAPDNSPISFDENGVAVVSLENAHAVREALQGSLGTKTGIEVPMHIEIELLEPPKVETLKVEPPKVDDTGTDSGAGSGDNNPVTDDETSDDDASDDSEETGEIEETETDVLTPAQKAARTRAANAAKANAAKANAAA